ncbi:MAG: iron-containing alcohol dehydrogenase [Alphaproteobacteria bacterium]|nr:iron-containing alcohol dehydrogenase [Alphaproteobacteria bacterium]
MQIDPKTLTGTWSYPTEIRFGPGRVAELPAACAAAGIEAPLFVTDPGLAALPMAQQALESLGAAGLRAGTFAEVQPNPLAANVAAGVEAYRKGRHDGVVAFGGGSAIDAAKAVALMVGQSRPLRDFEDVGDNWRRADADGIAPVVAVPTTAGTGSEVGRASVIADAPGGRKRIVFHPRMMPRVVLADPMLTIGLPPGLTAATGMDALTHCLEAYFAPSFHPIADGVALGGVRLAMAWLPKACADGGDIEARAYMMVAASMGAAAFQKGLGAVHSISHAVGALYATHHGLTNAIVLPYVLAHNADAISAKARTVAQLLGLPKPELDRLLMAILRLRKDINIPNSLKEIGIDDGRAEDVGRLAFEDPTRAGNPKPVTADELAAIFTAAVRGAL